MDLSIYCPHCHKYTALSVAPIDLFGRPGQPRFTSAIWKKNSNEQWWIGVCNSCNMPVLVLNDGIQIFPHTLPSPTDERIPKEIINDLDEAKMCFSVKCYRACSVMARRCVQNACIIKGANGEGLVKQIDELTKNGTLTKDIQEWATIVRWIGNDAAHPNKDPVLREDAEDALNLAEQLLTMIFVTPAIAQARKMLRGKE